MKSAIAAVALFAMGTLAAAMPVAEPKPSPTNVEANTPTFVADAALTTYYGTCDYVEDGPGTCNFSAAGATQSKPCGVNYKCKFQGEACHYNSVGDHAHCKG